MDKYIYNTIDIEDLQIIIEYGNDNGWNTFENVLTWVKRFTNKVKVLDSIEEI